MKKKPTNTIWEMFKDENLEPEFKALRKYSPSEKELKDLELRPPVEDEITGKKWHKEYSDFFETHAPKGLIYEQERTTFNYHLKTKRVEIISDEEEGPDYERTTDVPSLKIFNFWKNIYLAYCLTIPPSWEPLKDGGFKLKEVPKTPLNIASPKNRSEALEDLINQYPELLSNPDQFKGRYFTDKTGKNRGNVIKGLEAYLGGRKDRIQSYSMFKRVVKFTRLLVDEVSFRGDKQKYQLASIFLLGYLGVKLTPIQIKDYLRK